MVLSVASLFLYILDPETALIGAIALVTRYVVQLIRLFLIVKQYVVLELR